MLYIEEDLLSEVGKGHKSEGDGDPTSSAQVDCWLFNDQRSSQGSFRCHPIPLINQENQIQSLPPYFTTLPLNPHFFTFLTLIDAFHLQVAYRLNPNGLMSNVGWFAGFIGCFSPMWRMIGKGKQQEIEKGRNNLASTTNNSVRDINYDAKKYQYLEWLFCMSTLVYYTKANVILMIIALKYG